MLENFGKILTRLRNEKNLGQKILCDGLCSLSVLSRLESGEREPDYLLYDALFTRLGKDSKRGRMVVTEQDQRLFELRNMLEYALRIGDWVLFETKVSEYTNYSNLSPQLHEQYLLMLQGMLCYQKEQYEEAIEKYRGGLSKTNRFISDFTSEIKGLFSRNELRILCLLGQAMSKIQTISHEVKVDFLKRLYYHINTRYTDRLYLFRYEVFLSCCLADLFYWQGEYVESIFHCKKAMEELIAQKSRFYMKKILRIVENIRGKGYVMPSCFHNSHYLLEILEEWSFEKANDLGVDNRIYCVQSITTMKDIIKNTRCYWKKTQEELIGIENEILSQAGISQIETGKREPRKKAIEHCFLQLLLSGKEKRYYFPMQEESFWLQEQSYEVERYLSENKYEEAKVLYDKIKVQINENNVYNRQWIEKISVLLDKRNRKGGYHHRLINILEMTVPELKEMITGKRELSYYLTEEEANIYMNIGCSYHDQEMYDEAERYYQQLECYYQTYYPMLANKTFLTLLCNYSNILGLKGSYELSIEKSKQCIYIEIHNDLLNKFHKAIFNLAWCYGKKAMETKVKEKKEEYQNFSIKYFNQAFFLANLLGDEEIIQFSKICC